MTTFNIQIANKWTREHETKIHCVRYQCYGKLWNKALTREIIDNTILIQYKYRYNVVEAGHNIIHVYHH